MDWVFARYFLSHYSLHLVDFSLPSSRKRIKSHAEMERKKCELLLIGRIYLQEFNLFSIAQYLFSDMMHHLLQILERKWNIFFWGCAKIHFPLRIYVVLHRQHRVTVVHTCKACHIGIGDIQHQEYPVVSINIFGFHNFIFFIQFNVMSNAGEKLICHLHGLLKDNKSFS